MTTVRECLYNTIHRSKKPLKAIAEEIGMTENYLTRAALPDQEDSDTGTGCRFPLKKLIPLIKATGDFTVLDCIENNLGRFGVQLPPQGKACTADIFRLAMHSVKDFGTLMGEVEADLNNDGVIDEKENERIQTEGYNAVQAILSLMAACKCKGDI